MSDHIKLTRANMPGLILTMFIATFIVLISGIVSITNRLRGIAEYGELYDSMGMADYNMLYISIAIVVVMLLWAVIPFRIAVDFKNNRIIQWRILKTVITPDKIEEIELGDAYDMCHTFGSRNKYILKSGKKKIAIDYSHLIEKEFSRVEELILKWKDEYNIPLVDKRSRRR